MRGGATKEKASQNTVVFGWSCCWCRRNSSTTTHKEDDENGEERDTGSKPGQDQKVLGELGMDAEIAGIFIELRFDVLVGARGTAGGDDGRHERQELDKGSEHPATPAPAQQLEEHGEHGQTTRDDGTDVDHLGQVACRLDVVGQSAW